MDAEFAEQSPPGDPAELDVQLQQAPVEGPAMDGRASPSPDSEKEQETP
jgi:hypothetical protein